MRRLRLQFVKAEILRAELGYPLETRHAVGVPAVSIGITCPRTVPTLRMVSAPLGD